MSHNHTRPTPLKKRESTSSSREGRRTLGIIGWREWVVLPDLGVSSIKTKVDTGARSSTLHAFNVRSIEINGEAYVQFQVYPIQRNTSKVVEAIARVLEYRPVKSSSGQTSIRPVILTCVELLGQKWEIELTLANRDEMGFRMLLGRQAVRGRMLVNPGRSYLAGRPTGRSKSKHKSVSQG